MIEIVLILVASYIASAAYWSVYSYSQYATTSSNSWKVYSLIGVLPVINVAALLLKLIIEGFDFDLNPYEDVRYLKDRFNAKFTCKKCKLNLYRWQAVTEINKDGDIKHSCTNCKCDEMEWASNKVPVVNGHELTTKELIAFNKTLLNNSVDIKQKEYEEAYREQERILYNNTK